MKKEMAIKNNKLVRVPVKPKIKHNLDKTASKSLNLTEKAIQNCLRENMIKSLEMTKLQPTIEKAKKELYDKTFIALNKLEKDLTKKYGQKVFSQLPLALIRFKIGEAILFTTPARESNLPVDGLPRISFSDIAPDNLKLDKKAFRGIDKGEEDGCLEINSKYVPCFTICQPSRKP